MRRGTIQVNNYFARLGVGRVDLLPPPRSNKAFRAIASIRSKGLPVEDATDELQAAWQLGIVTAVKRDDKSMTWTIDGQRLSDIAGEGMPQAAEQLAAIIAVALEGLGADDYILNVSGPQRAAQYVDVFSTTYNALLARELGVTRNMLVNERPDLSIRPSMDEALRARVREASELVGSHGIRRMYKLQHEGVKVMKETIKEATQQKTQPRNTGQLTMWRHVQDDTSYKLSWYVELTEGKPAHITCSAEYATEAQRAVIETYTSLANRQLKLAGVKGIVQLGAGVQSGHFNGVSPIDEFTTVFATTFLTPEELTHIGLKNHAPAGQTDLLQSIETIVCERCGNSIQQFGSYGICIHCGDAQIVKN